MRKRFIFEAAVFILLLCVLALFMHPDLLSTPAERITLMQERGNYLHPFLYSGLIYLLLWLLRGIGRLLLRLVRRTRGGH